MSEKRFVLCKKGDVEYIEDNCCVQLYGFDVLCELLNEQQATIQSLKEENEQLRKELGDCEKFRYTVFKRLNEEHIKECSIK